MSIGLTGSHRTGKTTLAKSYGERYKTHVCLTSASGVFKELGYDPQKDYPLPVRLYIQEAILESFAQQYKTASDISGRSFITDRTPIDLMAYTLADINRHKLSEEDEERLAKYVRNCIDLCNIYFSALVVVQPGIALVEDPTKAPIGYGYIEHLSQIIMGLTVNERITAHHYYIPARTVDLEQRVLCVRGAYNQTLGKLMYDMRSQMDKNGLVSIH